MARCRIENPKKLRRLAAQISQSIVGAWTRGGTDHRIDCLLPTGEIVSVYKDGQYARSDGRWTLNPPEGMSVIEP
jgi:hypothetical protein